MDPQKFFIAKTLQGAVDAEVIALEDLYHHIPAETLAEHIPFEILWTVIAEGMQSSGLGFGGVDTTPPEGERLADPPLAAMTLDVTHEVIESEESPPEERGDFRAIEGEVDALFDQATGEEEEGEEVNFEVTEGLDDEMPPIPEEGIIVEEVDWDDEK